MKAIGSIGRWQIWICFVVFLCKFPIAWHQMSIIFLAPPIKFTCSDNAKSTKTFDNKCYANCTNYEYDRSLFKETIITQWNLVCDRTWLKNLTQTMFMFGILIGSMGFGHVSDSYGRRKPFLAATVLQVVTGIATAYSPNWFIFTTLRFLLAVAVGGTMVNSFVIVMEIIGPGYREIVGILYQLPFNLGHLSLPGFSYFLREWDAFQLSISLPCIIFLSYYWFLPESPRYLITTGKINEAVKLLEYAAKRNGRPTENIASYTQETANRAAGQRVERLSFVALFRFPKLRVRTICICFNWFACGLGFFGVSQYIGQISGNIFFNVAISAVIETFASLVSIFANQWLGRKPTLIGANTISGLSLLLIMIFFHSQIAVLILGCIGLWGITISFTTVYLYAGELFPTVVRNSGVGLASTIARIGSMVAPFIATSASHNPAIAPLTFGVAPLIGSALCLLLPETHGRKLPDTLQEAEQ